MHQQTNKNLENATKNSHQQTLSYVGSCFNWHFLGFCWFSGVSKRTLNMNVCQACMVPQQWYARCQGEQAVKTDRCEVLSQSRPVPASSRSTLCHATATQWRCSRDTRSTCVDSRVPPMHI